MAKKRSAKKQLPAKKPTPAPKQRPTPKRRPAPKKQPVPTQRPAKAPSPVKAKRDVSERLGGVHGDSAVLKDLLTEHGVRRADTGSPLSEALVFGIAGGIAAGYTLVPGFSATGLGSGLTFVGRHRQFLADGKWHTEFFRRLGLARDVLEEPHPERAALALETRLVEKRPTIVWCSAMAFSHLSWAATAGLHTVLARSIDRKRTRVTISDQGPTTFEIDAKELNGLRERVNPTQNRILSLLSTERGRKLEREELAAACVAGIKACVMGARDLEQRGRHASPLQDCVSSMAQLHHSRGWRNLFPDAQLFLVLSDVFQSIESAWNGGGWFRPLYAQFLAEAAELTGNARLEACVEPLRGLGARWTRFAESALPKRYAVFSRARDALREAEQIYAKKGRSAEAKIVAARGEIAKLEKTALSRFPLDGHAANRLLDDLAAELAELSRAEEDAAARVRAAVS